MQEILDYTFWNNKVETYLIALGIFILGFFIAKIFKKVFLAQFKKWSEKTETSIDDFIVRGIEIAVLPLLFYAVFYIAITTLNLSDKLVKALNIATIIVVTFYVIRIITSSVKFALNSYIYKQEKGEERVKQMRGITTIFTFLIWAFGIVFLIDNLGYNVSSVIAGLGIGGIAIALAAQTVLKDLFSYFVIFFDKPFEIGDFLNVGDKVGSVEYIGIKTTRLRSLSGEQLVFSNTDLVDSRIHNFKRMERRRVVFKLGVIYQTKSKQLAEIPSLVKGIIEEQENVTFDRGHFAAYGDFSLNFEFVYYIMSSDYVVYMDTHQKINLKIYDEFEKRKIEFAYPTQTLFMNKENENENIKSEIAE